jgi:hypothetical protein
MGYPWLMMAHDGLGWLRMGDKILNTWLMTLMMVN